MDIKELIKSLRVQEFSEEIEQMKISLIEKGDIHFQYDEDGCFSSIGSWN